MKMVTLFESSVNLAEKQRIEDKHAGLALFCFFLIFISDILFIILTS